MKHKKTNLFAILVLIDVVIKVIISNYLMDVRIPVGRAPIGFRPHLNKDQLSILNNELSLGVSIELLIGINLCSMIVLILFYYRMKKKEGENKYMDLFYVFLQAGSICSLIDKIFYKGSLDYILLFSKISDLKDVYLILGCGFGLIYVASEVKRDEKKV